MKAQTKMWLMIGGLVVLGILHDFVGMSEEIAFPGIVILALGFGWYARESYLDIKEEEDEKSK